MPSRRRPYDASACWLANKPFLDSSSDELEEAPAKVARIEAPIQLPAAKAAQYRCEAQRLVVGIEDLSSLTQGAAREKLEGRLGLEAGTFNTSKRLRQWACEVLQGEVDKRLTRTAKINGIAQAICRVEDYPAVCRRMLIEALPFATACPNGIDSSTPPHPHQVRILEMVSEVLRNGQQSALEGARGASEAASAAMESHDLKEATSVSAAVAATAKAKAELAVKNEALQDAQLVEQRARQDLERVQQTNEQMRKNMLSWKQNLAELLNVCDGLLRPLVDGACPSGVRKNNTMGRLCKKMTEYGAEGTLVHAARLALNVSPADRTDFLNTVVDEVKTFFSEQVTKLTSKIAEGEPALDAKIMSSAEAVLEAAAWNGAQKMLQLAEARDQHEEAEAVCQVERAELGQLQQTALDFERTAVDLEGQAKYLEEAIKSVEELMLCVEVPAPSTDRLWPGAEDHARGAVNHDPVAPEAAPPKCADCDRAMQWSDYACGDYSTGWECNNISTCKSGRDNMGSFRWFCSTCQNDYCSKCHPEASVATSCAALAESVARDDETGASTSSMLEAGATIPCAALAESVAVGGC